LQDNTESKFLEFSYDYGDRPKFGFGYGYGAETNLTYNFGLVTTTAKVQWHKFGFGRNITPKL